MATNRISYLDLLKQFQGGEINLPGIEEHMRFFRFRSHETAARDIYRGALRTDWGLARAKRLGLYIPVQNKVPELG